MQNISDHENDSKPVLYPPKNMHKTRTHKDEKDFVIQSDSNIVSSV